MLGVSLPLCLNKKLMLGGEELQQLRTGTKCLECLFGYFWDTMFNQCSSNRLNDKPRKNCPICNESGCLYCRPGYVLVNSACVVLTCVKKHCLYCQLDDPNICTVCNDGMGKYLTSAGECECNIKGSQGDYYGTCKSCTTLYCQLCDPTPFSCTHCDSFYGRELVGTSCVCQTLFFEFFDKTRTDGRPLVCKRCHKTCYACKGTTMSDCVDCGDPNIYHRYLTVKGECACIEGYGNVLSFSTQENKLVPDLTCASLECHKKCAECIQSRPGTSLEYCIKCIDGQNREISDDLDCVCQENYSDDGIYEICYKCYYACASCYGVLSKSCVKCSDSSHRYLSQKKECLCQDQYYDDNVNMECQQCHYSCQNCLFDSGIDKCTQCPSSRISIVAGSTFICTCQEIGYYDLDGTMECQPCHYSCLSCDGPELYNCLSCDTTYREFDSVQCNCPIASYDIGNLLCQGCHYSCKSCDNVNLDNCIECSEEVQYRVQIGNTCTCMEGYYDITGEPICGKCSYKCQLCKDTSYYCLSCPPNSGRQLGSDNSCSCTEEFYDEIQIPICKMCHFKCQSCTDATEQSCNSCNKNKFRKLINNECVCMQGYFEQEVQECQKCSSYCQECVDQYDNCTACSKDRYLNGNKCLCKTKVQGYQISTYELKGVLQCQNCHYTCLTCQKSSAPNQCITCLDSENRVQIGSTCICKDGYFEVGRAVCQKCSIQCKLCISKDDTCLECLENSLRVLNQMLKKCVCPDGYYDDGQNSLCQQCHYSCYTCSKMSTLCSECKASSHRQLNDLILTCPCNQGYFDSGVQECQKCHYSCLSCNSFQNCLSCINQSVSNRVLYLNSCICLPGYYDDGFSANCKKCDYQCLTCISQSYQCTSCPQTRNLQQNCDCLNGYYEVGYAQCSKCDANCFRCSKSPTQCIECNGQQNRMLNKQMSNCVCKFGYFELNGVCQQCNLTCYTCIDQQDNCTSCPMDRIQIGSVCKCNDGFYEDYNDKQCYLCHSSCLTCIYTATQCLSCISGDFRILKWGSKCECIDGYYENLTNQNCMPCNQTCLTCKYNANHCTSCDTSLHYDIQSNQCVCMSKYYYDVTTKSCQQCHFSCLQCQSQYECTTCNTLTREFDNISLKCICRNGYFETNTELCQQCHYSCSTCLSSSTNCQTCSQSYFRLLNNNQCQCLQGYYDVGVSMCQKCSEVCKTCQSSSTKCTSCYDSEQHRIQQGDQCTCQSGYFNSGSVICQKCSNSCKTCDIQSHFCTSCDLNQKRIDKSIQKKCPCITGFFEDQNQNCQKCHIKCYDCINSSETCISCNYQVNSHRHSLSYQCNCKDGYYDDGTQIQCQKCSYQCKMCLNASTNCSTCSNSFRSNPPLCNCIDGYFEDQQQTCQPCEYQCGTCITNPAYCLSCKPDRIGPTCECSDGYFEAGLNNCVQCGFQCLTCAQDSNNCTSCKGNRISVPICKCPNGFFDDFVNESCLQCHYTCDTCDANRCITCNGNRILSQEMTCDSPPGSVCYQDTPWCSSCVVAVLNIYFSDELDRLIIVFDFPLDDKLFQSYSLSNKCFQIFEMTSIDKLGRNPLCSVSPTDNHKLLIQLGDYPNINVGDQLLFNNKSLSHLSCEQPLSVFVHNQVKPPIILLQPLLEFDVPDYLINPCVETQIYQMNRMYDGKRALINPYWYYTSSSRTNKQLDDFIENQNTLKDFNLIIPAATLPINSNITFFVQFSNFLSTSQVQHFMISTHDGDSPTIFLNIKRRYFTFQQILLNFNIETIQCYKKVILTSQLYTYAVQLFQIEKTPKEASESNINYDITSSQKDHSIAIQEYKLSPNSNYTFQINVTNKISGHNQLQTFKIQIISAGILCQFDGILNVQSFAKDMNLLIQCKDLDTQFNWNADPDMFTEIECFELTRNQKCIDIHKNIILVNKTEKLQHIKKFSVEPLTIQEWSLKVTKKAAEYHFREVIVFLENEFKVQKINFNSGYLMRDINNFELLNFTFAFTEDQQLSLIDYSVGIVYDYQILNIISPTFTTFQFRLFDYITQMNRGNQINLRFNAQFTDNIMPNLYNLNLNLNQPVPCQQLQINQMDLQNNLNYYSIAAICDYSNNFPYSYQLKYFYRESDYYQYLKFQSDYSITFQQYQTSNKFELSLPSSMNSSNINILVQVIHLGGSITNIYQKFNIQKSKLNCTLNFNQSLSLQIKISLLFETYNNECSNLSITVLDNLKQILFTAKNQDKQLILSSIKLFKLIQTSNQMDKGQIRLFEEKLQEGTDKCFDNLKKHFIVYGIPQQQNESQIKLKNKITNNVVLIKSLISSSLLNLQSIVLKLNTNQLFWDQQLEQNKEFSIDSLKSSLILIDDIFQDIQQINQSDEMMLNQSMFLLDQINTIVSIIQEKAIVDGIYQDFEGASFNLSLKRISKKHLNQLLNIDTNAFDFLVSFCQLEQLSLAFNPYLFSSNFSFNSLDHSNDSEIQIADQPLKRVSLKNYFKKKPFILIDQLQNYIISFNNYTICKSDYNIIQEFDLICIVKTTNQEIKKCTLIQQFDESLNQTLVACQCNYSGEVFLLKSIIKDNTIEYIDIPTINQKSQIQIGFIIGDPLFIIINIYCFITLIAYSYYIYQELKIQKQGRIKQQCEISSFRQSIHLYPGNLQIFKKELKYLHQITALYYHEINHTKLSKGILSTFSLISFAFLLFLLEFSNLEIQKIWIYVIFMFINCVLFEMARGILKILRVLSRFGKIITIMCAIVQVVLLFSPSIEYMVGFSQQVEWDIVTLIVVFLSCLIVIFVILEPILVFIRIFLYNLILPSIKSNQLNPMHHLLYFFIFHENLESELSQYKLI
ncbi:unnamed protein product (macronuclear) [Paramecium tetraurelia]|uniref:EGF-like domain-containing protein n=1 Tax=Paramecium tetraurelia TaxID=5888 RepID=A0CAJ0_PARTE|nr:uncharacterized protein GSPATT00036587001 [Paramecium tetraurelia]CAK67807.1 unnamed protein product [Paramecium tetraurelia]|eukprot:XP_001435204.1 hypothetical protein (macronuclear) [Paramecium tetraurelia strain d4-2]